MLFAVACGGSQSSYPNVGPGIGDDLADHLFPQAQFELGCPRNQIQLVKLAKYKVGASGCGRRAVYQRVPYVGWVQESGPGR